MRGVYSDYALTVPTDWLIWLATSSARLTLYRMQGVHGPMRLLHILSVSAFFGGIVLLDLRLVGALGRDIALDSLARLVLPVVHTAFAIALLSGTWLFLYDPIQTGAHTWFLPKLLLISVACINAAIFSRPRRFGLRAIAGGALTRHARTAGLLSLVLWTLVMASATGNQEERPIVRGRAGPQATVIVPAN